MKRVAALLVFLLMVGFVAADEGREGGAELGGLASFGVFLIFAGTAYYALTKRRLIIEHRKGSPK